jgi:hypothetical protein
MAKFEVVVGMSTKTPEQAAKNAESKAKKAGGEQIGITSTVCCGTPGTDPLLSKLLHNIATNIFRCQCKTETLIGVTIKKIMQGVPPPALTAPPGPSAPLWVVYILIKH